MFEEPEIHVITFPVDEEAQLERERQAGESRRRAGLVVSETLAAFGVDRADAPRLSEAVLDALFVARRIEDGTPCSCSCHPSLPGSGFHDYGDSCSCRKTAEERRSSWDEMFARQDEFWESEEGRAIRARRQHEEDELLAYLAGDPDVVVTTFGGEFPEQWWGSVDGRRFYFREKHGDWRIELDLRGSGHFYRAWKGGDLDDEGSYELKESERGDVIAEGTLNVPGYGETPLERARFIVGTIRDHLGRESCVVHGSGLEALRAALQSAAGTRPGGDAHVELRFCPSCGRRISG